MTTYIFHSRSKFTGRTFEISVEAIDCYAAANYFLEAYPSLEPERIQIYHPNLIVTKLIGKKWKGFAFYPWIFSRPEHKEDEVFINHERIHLAQQKELWLIGFYVWYLWELSLHGYRGNIFEKEAYYYAHKLDYLEDRPKFNFRKF